MYKAFHANDPSTFIVAMTKIAQAVDTDSSFSDSASEEVLRVLH